jgi:hypothetical protein
MDGIVVDVLNYMIYLETNDVNFYIETYFYKRDSIILFHAVDQTSR